jgi:hypothetical protein
MGDRLRCLAYISISCNPSTFTGVTIPWGPGIGWGHDSVKWGLVSISRDHDNVSSEIKVNVFITF